VREREQTGIYRVLNALDGGLSHALEAVAQVLGPVTPERARSWAGHRDPGGEPERPRSARHPGGAGGAAL